MELLVAADSLFYKTPDGKYWCQTIYGYDFWLRYLEVFEKVNIVSRTKKVEYKEIDKMSYLRVDGPGIRVSELPFMRGMKQYMINYPLFVKSTKKAIENATCALFRLPSVSASMVMNYYKRTGKPYVLEVVADPEDAYSSNIIAQKYYTNNLKEAALQADGVSYVTKHYLQEKYPSNAGLFGETYENFESYYSTINMTESYITSPRTYKKDKSEFTIVHTANSINNDMKGHGEVMKILKMLRKMNYNVKVVFIGDGDIRQYYEQMSQNLGVENHVRFTGLLSSSKAVKEVLLNGDIFVFPTKAEGLPRAIIEAMAVGLPVLSTPVNGIPELLDNEYMFNPLDVELFANKLTYLFENPVELEKMSKQNIEKAREYTNERLSIRRRDFYLKLKRKVQQK